jgi:hypothetical protein
VRIVASEQKVPQHNPRLRRKFILAAMSLAGLLLAVAGMMPAATAVESLSGRLVLDLPDWLGTPFAVLIGLEVLLILYVMVPGLRSRGRTGKPRSTVPGLVLLLLIGTALWLGPPDRVAGFIATLRGLVKFDGGPGSTAEALTEAPAVVQSALISGLLESFLLALLLIGFGVIAWLYLAVLPARGRGVPPAVPHAELQAAVDLSLDDLRSLPDVRQAIIRCYERFERVLAGADIRRSSWQTVMEFKRIALNHPRLPRQSVEELTQLFEIARFSRHELGSGHREQAWRALMTVKAALEQEDIHAATT